MGIVQGSPDSGNIAPQDGKRCSRNRIQRGLFYLLLTYGHSIPASRSARPTAQRSQCETIIVSGLHVAHLRLGLLELGMVQTDQGTKTEFVARLGPIERLIRLLEKLLRNSEAVVSGVCVEPSHANVPHDAVPQVFVLLLDSLRSQVCCMLQCGKAKTVEDEDDFLASPVSARRISAEVFASAK